MSFYSRLPDIQILPYQLDESSAKEQLPSDDPFNFTVYGIEKTEEEGEIDEKYS